MRSIGISDHGSCGAHVDFFVEAKKAGIRPILGIELYCAFEPTIHKYNRDHTHMVCFARNKNGIKDLWKMSSYTNNPNIYYYKPRINLFNHVENSQTLSFGIEEFAKNRNLCAFSGHQGSHLSDNLFADLFGDSDLRKANIRKAYAQYKISDPEYYRKFLRENWLESTCDLAIKIEGIFGKGNFWIELQNELNPNDRLPLWIHPTIVECLRQISKETNIPVAASSDPHYAYREQAEDQRLMLKVNMKETDESVETKLSDSDNLDVMVFFGSDNFYIHSYEEMAKKFTEAELNETLKIAEQIEEYDILEKPKIPQFKVPNLFSEKKFFEGAKTDSDNFMMQLAIRGAQKLKPWEKNSKNTKLDYWDRIRHEANIVFKAGLSNYLLIVWDFIEFCRHRPADNSYDWLANLKKNGKIDPIVIGSGRGSVGGSLLCYMLGIHKVDSLKYDLLFSRFFNEARMSEMMDIDTDIEMSKRDVVVEYLTDKYGQDNVGGIITFGRIQGRASIKDIFRVKGIENGFEIANKICENIPDESKIIDEIQEVRESGEEYGIVRWALDHSEPVQEAYANEKYKPLFDQAIRVEGTKRNASRHASGFVITTNPISESFPLVLDTKTKKRVVGFDMNNVAKVGGVKMDLLGLTLLDKLKMCQDLVNK